MARNPRAKSETGIHHVMLRGIDQTQLFYDDSDRIIFLERLQRYKAESGFLIYAYCLMGNHVHLLIKEGAVGISEAIKRLATSYAHYYNAKYDRNGYLFQNRFRSKPVNNNRYFLAVVRYIITNPVHSGERISYWNSFDDYTVDDDGSGKLTDTEFALGMFSEYPERAKAMFAEFVSDTDVNDPDPGFEENSDERLMFLGCNEARHIKDGQAMEMIKNVAQIKHCGDLVYKDKAARDLIITLLKSEGLSIRQISRLTGINRGVVLSAGKSEK